MEWLTSFEFTPILAALRLNMFDALLLGALGWGVYQGKEQGASSTHVSVVQWMVIALPGGLAGAFLGSFLGPMLGSAYWGQLTGYLIWIFIVVGFFAFLNSKGASEWKEADWFGKTEYPLGVLGCMIKYFCIVLTVMSLLNANYYTSEMIRRDREWQIEEFGSALFPSFTMLNNTVFNTSFSGPPLKKTFEGWAILPSAKPLRR
ncbi:MAG: hypothetical protein ACPGVU_25935 [Limisphaerales bacterium]